IVRMTDVSIPLVKLSLSIESKSGDLVASASDLADSENEMQRFERMEQVSDQTSQLWGLLGNLQATITDKTSTTRLQELVAKLDSEIGAIDRNSRDYVATAARRKTAVEQVAKANETILRLISPLYDQLSARVESGAGRTDLSPVELDG